MAYVLSYPSVFCPMNKLAFCITGWHYSYPEIYQKLKLIEGATLFVISHKPNQDIPDWLYNYVETKNVIVQPNLGYDWGCYQQFLDLGKWRNFDYIFFMHDDLEIKGTGFVQACLELLQKHSVVGNGRVASPTKWPMETPQSYAHARWKPPNQRFEHDAVRGSFFATTRLSLELIGGFEIFWDPLSLTVGFGNWSLRATCAKWQFAIDKSDCFGFLAESYCESPWISEFYRGGNKNISSKDSAETRVKRLITHWVTAISRLHMKSYWSGKIADRFTLCFTGVIVAVISGNWSKSLSFNHLLKS